MGREDLARRGGDTGGLNHDWQGGGAEDTDVAREVAWCGKGAGSMHANRAAVACRSTFTAADSERHCSLARIPAWVVTFEGVNYTLPGGDGAGPEYAHEVHVVVDAQTVEDLELFSYQ